MFFKQNKEQIPLWRKKTKQYCVLYSYATCIYCSTDSSGHGLNAVIENIQDSRRFVPRLWELDLRACFYLKKVVPKHFTSPLFQLCPHVLYNIQISWLGDPWSVKSWASQKKQKQKKSWMLCEVYTEELSCWKNIFFLRDNILGRYGATCFPKCI